MAMASRLQKYLKEREADYRLVAHPHSGSSMESAEQAHVPGDALAKGVVVKEQGSYLLVVLPSDYHVELESLQRILQRDVAFAHEAELGNLFPDCELGAVPPIGDAYGLTTLWDPSTSLGQLERIFFESGDHEHLVSVSGEQFHELMAPAERAEFSHHI